MKSKNKAGVTIRIIGFTRVIDYLEEVLIREMMEIEKLIESKYRKL